MKVLVIAEHDGKRLRPSTYSTIKAGLQLSNDVTVLVAGSDCAGVVEETVHIDKVSTVIIADHAVYKYPLAESLAPLILHHSQTFTHLLAPATTFGKNIMPRVSALLDVAQVSDIVEVVDQQTYCRPIYAGNAIAKIK